jgi:iron complex transport system ATP-binding protein
MLEIEGLSVTLGDAPVLYDISAIVAASHWLAVLGPNGAGKTTLLRAVVGLIPYDGEIRIDQARRSLANRRAAARLVAYVPQRPVLPPSMRIADYVLLGRTAHQGMLGGESVRDRVVTAEVIERLDLGALAHRGLGEVSGGEAQRAVLARALAQEAPVLALDEPTSSLDLGHGQHFLELADELRRERGLCVISALHDLTLAGQYADEVMLLQQGKIAATGTAREVLTPGNIERIFGASVTVVDSPDGPLISPRRPQPAGAHEQS